MYGWQDSYSVGVQEFDSAHKQLFTYFNDFHTALVEGKSQEQIGVILDKTFAYTRQHFESEEKWLALKNDPDLANHKVLHRKFQAQISQLIADNKGGKIGLSGTVSKVLREWLSSHIMQTDQAYAARLKTKDTVH